ncbi:MAG: high-potential iron-sulfur protein [Bauldia sp.]
MSGDGHSPTRRRVLLGGLGVAGAGFGLGTLPATAQAPGGAKFSKDFAGYVASGGPDRCEDCTRYRPGKAQDDGSCELVEGTVGRDGWCKFYDD